MPVLLVAYDLKNGDSNDYEDILDVIREYSNVKLSESSYAIDTRETPTEIYNKIKPLLNKGDHIYVISLSNPKMGHGSKSTIGWLEDRIN